MARTKKHPLLSRKLWITIGGVVAIVAPAIATGGTSWPVVVGVIGPVCAYLIGQSRVDTEELRQAKGE